MDGVNIFNKDLRVVVRKEVDFIPGAWVDFYDDLTMGDIKKAQDAKEAGDIFRSFDVLINQIADWNFADENKKILPITIDSLGKFPSRLLKWLVESEKEVVDLEREESKKKESPNSSL